MKSINDYIKQYSVSEASTNDFEADDFFDEKMIKLFYNQLDLIYKNGEDSDINTGLHLLLKEYIEKNPDKKTGIVGACEDIVKEFKK